MDIQKQQLQLQENRENKAEQVEKEKANAVADAKYDEILAASTELEDYLEQVADWSKQRLCLQCSALISGVRDTRP